MATTVSTVVYAYLAALLNSGTGVGKSSAISVLLSVGGFMALFEAEGFQPNTANISSGWEINCYRSPDGVLYETLPTVPTSITRNPNTKDRRTIELGPGYWVITLTTSGSAAATWSFNIGTVAVATAIQNA